ncbi:acyltransferase [Clostridium lacusfryxellense]|uniref:acyltransferase n=1 Tax=Clostridium lacusfryxellense TaxID=205328 RepID=UPI001C0D2EA1|nr:acyltransferase [Clostridium lacusfryxellense]MBU3112291.1 acyltransferase [Clostridium lacusfryxellense]
MSSFYANEELKEIGFKTYGKNVLISRKSSIYSPEEISLGNNVRIDDFCILSGKINIGDYIHIAAYSALYGGVKGIVLEDFSNISSKVCIYAISDDYSGETMTNPMVSNDFKKIIGGKVVIKRHVIIGSGCVVLPNIILEEGSAFGALSLINKNSQKWSINAGIPSKKIKDRSENLLNLEQKFLERDDDNG